MKSPAFQFYAADYLADEMVSLMSLEEEGAYVRLLAYCWREGSIPADETLLSRLCKGASTTVIRVVTNCFQPCVDRPDRLTHKRLDEEREKQAEWREKSAAGGRKSAEKRWGNKPQKPATSISDEENKGGYNGGDKGGVTLQSSTSSSSSTSTLVSAQAGEVASQVVTPAPASQPNTKPARPREYEYDEAPIFQLKEFFAYLDSIGYAHVDKGTYLLQIQAKGKQKMIRTTNERWQDFIKKYLNVDKAAGCLLLPSGSVARGPGAGQAPAPSLQEKLRRQRATVAI